MIMTTVNSLLTDHWTTMTNCAHTVLIVYDTIGIQKICKDIKQPMAHLLLVSRDPAMEDVMLINRSHNNIFPIPPTAHQQ
jgi:hypothetical protein